MIRWLGHWDALWMLVYRDILGMTWCGHVWVTMQCKMLLAECTMQFLW